MYFLTTFVFLQDCLPQEQNAVIGKGQSNFTRFQSASSSGAHSNDELFHQNKVTESYIHRRWGTEGVLTPSVIAT